MIRDENFLKFMSSNRDNIKRAFANILQEITKNPDLELEVRFHDRFNKIEICKFQSNLHPSVFQETLAYFESGKMDRNQQSKLGKLIKCKTTDYTDNIIKNRDRRLIINHSENTETLIRKQQLVLPAPFNARQHINPKGFKIALSNEQEIDSNELAKFKSDFTVAQGRSQTIVRKKHRKTFIQALRDDFNNESITVFRFDFTVVNSSLFKEPKYEIEMEYLGNRQDPKFIGYIHQKIDLIAELFLDNLETLLSKIQQSLVFLTWNEHNKVIEDYQQILNIRPNVKSGLFKGAQPETLHKSDLHTLKKNPYFVTYKSDGKRGLLFVNKDCDCYIIGRFMHIVKTETKMVGFANSLFDGEWFFDKRVFEIFDVMCLKGDDIRQKKSSERFASINSISFSNCLKNECKKDAFIKGDIQVYAKKHYYLPENVLDYDLISNVFYSSEKTNDGLVFTPDEYYPNRRKWKNLLKWKPSTLNSIDLYVEKSQDSNNYNLFVNSVLIRDNKGKEGVLIKRNDDTVQFRYFDDSGGILKQNTILQAQNVNVYHDNHIKLPFPFYSTIDTDIIEQFGAKSGQVVEFVYNNNDNSGGSGTLKPIRIRNDKSSEGWLGSNFISVACDVWESMVDPLLIEHFDLDRFKRRKKEERKSHDNELIIFKYHNQVKRNLIESVMIQKEHIDFKTILNEFNPLFDEWKGYWVIDKNQKSIDLLPMLPLDEYFEDEQKLYLPLPKEMVIDKKTESLYILICIISSLILSYTTSSTTCFLIISATCLIILKTSSGFKASLRLVSI